MRVKRLSDRNRSDALSLNTISPDKCFNVSSFLSNSFLSEALTCCAKTGAMHKRQINSNPPVTKDLLKRLVIDVFRSNGLMRHMYFYAHSAKLHPVSPSG